MTRTLMMLTVILGGCEPTGAIRYQNDKEGIRWSVTSPANAELPASLSFSETGIAAASTGPVRGVDQALRQLRFLPLIGGIAILVGVGGVIARKWIPTIPLTGCLMVAAAGVGLIFLPKLVQEAWWMIFVVAALIAAGWWDNRRQQKKLNP